MTEEGLRPGPSAPNAAVTEPPKRLPKGVVLDENGKPCRSCTSFASWASMAKKETTIPSTTAASTRSMSSVAQSPILPEDCPPDVERLGNHTWTLLHSLSATYPERAPPEKQSEMRQFLNLFASLYPCWVCAGDFRDWMTSQGNQPKLGGRDEFGHWMCEAHNEVNRKLGKKEFDCSRWQERWRTGWKDGRCD